MPPGSRNVRPAGRGDYVGRVAEDDPHAVADLLAYLEGRWSVERTVEDRAGGGRGRFLGELRCTRGDGPGLLTMHEDGELDWAGVRRRAFRTTRLVVAGDDPGIGYVTFDDGRHFHDLDLRSGRWDAAHPCAPDAYRGTFVVHGPDRWAYGWLVTGPKKDLRLATELDR